jgi:hypothetical protein
VYDVGDSWLQRLELVSRQPEDEGTPPAPLIDGARRGPLEDSGGFSAYEEILASRLCGTLSMGGGNNRIGCPF